MKSTASAAIILAAVLAAVSAAECSQVESRKLLGGSFGISSKGRGGRSRYPRGLLKLPRNFDDAGSCGLDNTTGTFDTEWFVPLENLVTYPCSKGYLGNLGANTNLLDDFKDAVTKAGKANKATACGDKCDFDNAALKGAMVSPKTFEQESFFDLLRRKADRDTFLYFCNDDESKGPLGALNKLWDEKRPEPRMGVNACKCGVFGEVNFDYGCTKCIGTVDYRVSKCYNTGEDHK